MNSQLINFIKRAKCPDCDGNGFVLIPNNDKSFIISHEQAMEACMPSMEGKLYTWYDKQKCEWCAEKDRILKYEQR